MDDDKFANNCCERTIFATRSVKRKRPTFEPLVVSQSEQTAPFLDVSGKTRDTKHCKNRTKKPLTRQLNKEGKKVLWYAIDESALNTTHIYFFLNYL